MADLTNLANVDYLGRINREGPICIAHFPAMTLATFAIAGPIELEMRALEWLYTT